MAFVALEKLVNLYEGYRRTIRIGNTEVMLLQYQGQPYVIGTSCPHMEWSLMFAKISNGAITCSKHGWQFSITDGRPLNVPGKCNPLATYPVIYDGNRIGIDVP